MLVVKFALMEIRPHLSSKDIKSVAAKIGRISASVSLALIPFKIALADSGGISVEDSAPRQTAFVDRGEFPQCQTVKLPERSILFEDPLTAPLPYTAVHPQLRSATEALNMNGIYGLVDRQILPQKTLYRLSASAQMENYCLPQKDHGWARTFIKVTESSSLGLPSGGENGLVQIDLPAGINPIVVTIYGPSYKDGTSVNQDWLLFMLGQDETIRARNVGRDDYRLLGRGPFAIPIYKSAQYGDSIEFVLPEDGFAGDKPIPIFPKDLDMPVIQAEDGDGNVYRPFRQYPQCGGEVDIHSWWGGKYRYPDNHTLLVTVMANQYLDRFIYDQKDLGPIPGQCGNP